MKIAALLASLALAASSIAQDTKPAQPPEAKPETPAEEKLVYVKLSTSMGDIFLELDNEKAPVSTANFLAYVEKGHYDGTVFHRVIDNFMIQGGGFTADLKQKPTDKPIKNEWKNGLKNVKGSIAMARLGRQPDSATAQFFINVKDNPFLDEARDGAGYAVFGKVVAGMDVVGKIKAVKTAPKPPLPSDVPVETVSITKAAKVTEDDAKAAIDAEKK